MNILVREQIKILLAHKNITIKKLCEMLTTETGINYRADSFSHKLRRGTVTYNDVILIAKVLGYNIKFEEIN